MIDEVVQYLSFLPYGKHSFYIIFAYLVCIIAIGFLIYSSKTSLNKAKKQLTIKYQRENK